MTKILIGRSDIDLDYPVCRPSLDLDFTQEELDPRITFTRGSIGTRVNRNRLIETVDANQPRFDYDPVTGECKGLLIEESRTNYANQTLVAVNSTLQSSSDTTYIPVIGESKVHKFTLGTNSSAIQFYIPIYNAPGYTSTGVTDTVSFYLKSDSPVTVSSPYSGTASVSGLYFSNGTTTTYSVTSTTSPGPLGFTRYTFSYFINQTNGNAVTRTQFIITGTPGTNYYVFGAQFESRASFPTSYIPTTASTVTRSADLASMTGTNFSSWYNQSEGTLYADLNNITTRTSITFDRFVALVGTDVNRNVISICTQTASGGGAQNKFLAGVSYSPDGSYVVDTFTGAVSGGGGPDRTGKAILAYKKDNFAFTVNGITPLRDISGDIPTCNQLLIYGSARFQPAPSGTVKRITYYPRALKPNQLQYLTQ